MAAVFTATAPAAAQTVDEERELAEVFLARPGVWEGEFQNFVNRGNGVTQTGRIRVSIERSGDTIRIGNTFLDAEGNPTGYTGYTSLLRNGRRLEPTTIPEVDENTGNVLREYRFVGHILDNHIYIHEAYNEVVADGREEPRQNTLHYYLISEHRVLQVADVWVDGQLLVVAGTALERP